MSGAPGRRRFDDGRWHFQHGPIDLLIDCEGDREACDAASAQAWDRFQGVLSELVPTLAGLRSPLDRTGRSSLPADAPAPPYGPIARRMIDACAPFARDDGLFLTPMAAVAGSVADEIIAAFRRPGILRAYVNNGGDIALHLTGESHFDVGLISDLALPAIDGRFRVCASSTIRGIATSGWRGRSFSLGIADSVTVLAESAAKADSAATMIANHVDVPSPAVHRRPADELKDDTDLGSRMVTVAVGRLSDDEVATALDRGADFADRTRRRALIQAAALSLCGQVRVVRSR